jgi:hypothetical protein
MASRVRRATTEERLQLRWLAFAGGLLVISFICDLLRDIAQPLGAIAPFLSCGASGTRSTSSSTAPLCTDAHGSGRRPVHGGGRENTLQSTADRYVKPIGAPAHGDSRQRGR